VRADGHVSCWGDNLSGQLGDGTFVDRTIPVAVSGLDGVVALGVGDYHACAARGDSTLRCWGYNAHGQVGVAPPGDQPTPVWPHWTPLLNDGSHGVAVGGGEQHTCVVRADGGIRCWGRGTEGQLGNGASVDSTAAVSPIAFS